MYFELKLSSFLLQEIYNVKLAHRLDQLSYH